MSGRSTFKPAPSDINGSPESGGGAAPGAALDPYPVLGEADSYNDLGAVVSAHLHYLARNWDRLLGPTHRVAPATLVKSFTDSLTVAVNLKKAGESTGPLSVTGEINAVRSERSDVWEGNP
ncbi:MAG TPA: hypothetical protein VD932_02225 [Aquabacterium sp.]|nr:hypothetical protein [Aquabacterium sp.]